MGNRTVAEEALTALAQGVADAVVAVDQEGKIRVFNAGAERAFGVSAQEATGQRPSEIAALTDLAPLVDAVRRNGGATQQTVELAGRAQPVQLFMAESQSGSIPQRVYDLVHDLKQPIAAAKGFIDLTEAFGELNERQATYARRAQISLLTMLSLVNEVLDMAWMEAGGVLQRKPVSLIAIVERALKDYGAFAQHQGVDLVVEVPPCDLDVDSARLESVISNLVSNAIKYSPDGGTVRVSAACDETRLTVRVADEGLGIASEHLPHIFERFYRVQSPATERIKGTGLGLAIVQTVVERHGGEVSVESTPGEGSVFSFTLPRHAPAEV